MSNTVPLTSDDDLTTPATSFDTPPAAPRRTPMRRPATGQGLSTTALAAIGLTGVILCALCFFAGLQVGKGSSQTGTGGFPGGSGSQQTMGTPPGMSGGQGNSMTPPSGNLNGSGQSQSTGSDNSSSTVQTN